MEVDEKRLQLLVDFLNEKQADTIILIREFGPTSNTSGSFTETFDRVTAEAEINRLLTRLRYWEGGKSRLKAEIEKVSFQENQASLLQLIQGQNLDSVNIFDGFVQGLAASADDLLAATERTIKEFSKEGKKQMPELNKATESFAAIVRSFLKEFNEEERKQMSEPVKLTEETKTLLTILRHQTLVGQHLLKLAKELEDRALMHDLSKLELDEFAGFVEINRIARQHKYGSDEYKASIGANDAVKLHLSRNPHHPEFHPGRLKDMGLLDLIEMVIDWKAASETYGQTSFDESLQIQRERFKMTEEQYRLIQLIAEEVTRKK